MPLQYGRFVQFAEFVLHPRVSRMKLELQRPKYATPALRPHFLVRPLNPGPRASRPRSLEERELEFTEKGQPPLNVGIAAFGQRDEHIGH